MTLPTLPLVDPNQLATTGNLASLKQAAANNSPQALREAARQFESLFTSMMLKSMQEANFKDPLFGSDQGDLYQDMYDDQLAAVMSRGKGLGLADMLVQQLRREGTGGADPAGGSDPVSDTAPAGTAAARPAAASISSNRGNTATSHATGTTGAVRTTGTTGILRTTGTTGPVRTTAAAGTPGTECPTNAQQAAFAHALWPDAQQAARQLGVNPVTLLAQAALETNWGRDVPQGGSGGTSNNLFGIKAGSSWGGPAVADSTQEYSDGAPTTVKAQFRSYGSTSQCFQDYVGLLKGNQRYAAALGTGNDVQAFGSALQQGGYATDPDYAGKLTAVAGTLSHALTQGLPLKFAANPPTTSGSGPLQRR